MIIPLEQQRILVTGGAGFIGSHTVDLLLQQGYVVRVLDNLSSGKLTYLNLSHPNLEFIEGDILEYPLLKDLMEDCHAVLHLAAIASVPLSVANPIYTLQVNTQGVLHVLEAVLKTTRNIRLVYASSAAVYGNATQLPCRDDQPLSAVTCSPYALQKRQAEEYADLYARLHGIKSLGLRYFNVYGLRQDPQSPYSGVISRFLSAYQQEASLTVFGDGQQSRDFISVKDVARANVLALQNDYHGALNIATGKSETLLHLIDYIQAAGARPAQVCCEPARVGDIQVSYGSIQLAQTHLQFHYSQSLREGIKQLVGQ
jgi:nucleoside-diphosphate-sugar epimerase